MALEFSGIEVDGVNGDEGNFFKLDCHEELT